MIIKYRPGPRRVRAHAVVRKRKKYLSPPGLIFNIPRFRQGVLYKQHFTVQIKLTKILFLKLLDIKGDNIISFNFVF